MESAASSTASNEAKGLANVSSSANWRLAQQERRSASQSEGDRELNQAIPAMAESLEGFLGREYLKVGRLSGQLMRGKKYDSNLDSRAVGTMV